ncbi:MAG: hypothetical protein CL608_14505 [Anaerolineaceae bacterium]|nr:hypothetical protein [Anaerolineaceae bacterium]
MKAILFYLNTILLLLAACTAAATPEASPQPTPQASATSTVVAQPTAVPTLTPQPTPTNTLPPTETAVPVQTPTVDLYNNKTILYYDAADGHYYRIDLDGGEPDRLTQQPDSGHIMPDMVEQGLLDFNTPSVSPDGRFIAVAQDEATDDMGLGEIWLIDSETGDTFRAEGYQGSPEIALGSIFTWLDEEALLIYNLPEGGSARYVLANVQTIRFPNLVWSASPDGRFFYTHDGQLLDATAALLHQIADPTACPDGIRIRQNAWSPDSSNLAFVSACHTTDTYAEDWTLTIVDVVRSVGKQCGSRYCLKIIRCWPGPQMRTLCC